MGTRWPSSRDMVFDNVGDRALFAQVFFFDPGTTTPRAVYRDADLTTTHPHPVVADGFGRWPAIFLQYGSYKEEAKTAENGLLWSDDNIPNPAPVTDDTEVDEDAQLNTGDVFFSLKNGTRSGAVRLNGRTIGNASSGATERANADTANLFAFIWDNLANAQAAVSGGRGASAAADYAANKTIALPDGRTRNFLGFDDMGNSQANRHTAIPVTSGSAIIAGSILGTNTHTLQASETPSHSHTYSATTSSDNSHSHTFSGTSSSDGAHTHTGTTVTEGTGIPNPGIPSSTNGSFTGPGGTGWGGPVGSIEAGHTHGFTTSSNGVHTHSYSGTTSTQNAHSHTLSGTTSSVGSGSAHNIVSQSVVGTFFMRL